MNRNKLMLKNAIVVVFTMVLNTIFGMVEVSMFISKYGSEINGLMQTGNQVLNYLSLIEAGLCSAFLYSMYKPVAQKDYKKISSLYKGFKKSMSATVNKMLICALGICIIYPFFVETENLTYFSIMALFVLLSVKYILPYKITMVPKYMIVLKEQKYKAEFIAGMSRTITYLTEIVLMLFVDWSIHILLIACIAVSLLTGLWFKFEMKKLYKGTLVDSEECDISPQKMSTDILAHNLSRLAFSSTGNIVLSTLGSLNAVTIYSSYNMVVGQVMDLAQRFLDGASASMGIKIANQDDNAYSVYREMLVGSMWIASVITSVFVVMMNSFVALWIGEIYCVEKVDIILFAMVMYCGILLPCIQVARNACGLYKESRNFTIAQAIVNLVLTIVLVPNMGITGALLGNVVSRICITIPCNYFLVDRKVFPEHKSKWIELLVNTGVMFGTTIVTQFVVMEVGVPQGGHWLSFVWNAIISVMVTGITTTGYYLIFQKEFRAFLRRIIIMLPFRSKKSR